MNWKLVLKENQYQSSNELETDQLTQIMKDCHYHPLQDCHYHPLEYIKHCQTNSYLLTKLMVKSPTESNQTTLAAELHNMIDTYRRILTSLVRGNGKKRRKLFKANKSTCEPHVDSFKAIYTKTERSTEMPLLCHCIV